MKRQTTLALIAIIVAVGVTTVPLTQNAHAEGLIPDWIKLNAEWWVEGAVDDQTFLDGIEFMIENEIINVSSESKSIDVETLTIGFIPVEKAEELTSKAEALEGFLRI